MKQNKNIKTYTDRCGLCEVNILNLLEILLAILLGYGFYKKVTKNNSQYSTSCMTNNANLVYNYKHFTTSIRKH